MSALCQKQTSLDYLISASEQRRRHRRTECLGSPEIDGEFKIRGQFNWKLARFLALENIRRIGSSIPFFNSCYCLLFPWLPDNTVSEIGKNSQTKWKSASLVMVP
jgi:hypothetical protein